tara:strand:- start:28018 stop:30360 length:2343 start_codon:yes stop_codon:yes gene_type:complete
MARQVRFGDWHFCRDTGVLDRDGTVVSLEPRVAALLQHFLDHPGELLSRDQLVAEVWEGRVVSDDAIRRAVSSLRRALALDGSDKLITTVHKKGYLASLPVPVPVPAPGPAPMPMDAGVEAAPAATRRRNPVLPRRSLLLLAVMLLFTTLGAAWHLLQSPIPDAQTDDVKGPPYTLAVLPFVDLSENADNGFLADGLAEELLGLLGRFDAFRVPARSSSFQFRGQVVSPREVGEALGVRYLVEGSVRRDGDQVSVDVRLVEAATGFQLWSENYQRDLAGLFALQSDIGTQVARALQVALVEPTLPAARALEAAGPAGAKAYLEYLRARQLMSSWGTADLEAAIAHLQNAIALAPDFAPAYTRLAEAILTQASGRDDNARMQTRDTVKALIEKSLALDPDLGEAYGLRSSLWPDGEEALKEQDLRRSIALSPSYTLAYRWLAEYLYFQLGRGDEAIALIDQARALDPLLPRNHYLKALMMLDSCEHERAAELARDALRVNPRFRSGLVMLARVAEQRGELAEAVRLQEQALELDPRADWLRERLHMTYTDLGDIAAAREMGGDHFRTLLRESLFLANHAATSDLIYSAEPLSPEAAPHRLWRQTDVLLVTAMTSGDYARARRYLSDHLEYNGGLPQTLAPKDLFYLLNMVLVWYGPDHDTAAQGLINRLWTEMNAMRGEFRSCLASYQPLAHALAGVSLGRHDEAIAVLESAIDNADIASSWHWIILNHPAFAPLLEEPRLQELLQQRQAVVAEQREILERMRAEGVVPLRGQGSGSPAPG